MDYQSAESQAVQLQNQSDQVAQQIKGFGDKLQAKVKDPDLSRELALDLRNAAAAIQQQNQSTLALIDQMAEHIHALESHVNSLPQSGFQTGGWANQSYVGRGGGFMGSIMSGLGMGAGFGLASDLMGSIF
ncbi:MAG: hypothetical protein ACREEL_11635 [Stellaceae bacterium]